MRIIQVNLAESIFIISAVLIGGTGNIKGPVVGAIFVVVLPELLRFVAMPDSIAANMRMIIYGLTLIVLMMFRSQGIAGVNPKLNDIIAEIIKRMVYENNISFFLIEHNMHFVKQISDTCAFINKGKIEIIGTPNEVIANENVRKSYLGT